MPKRTKKSIDNLVQTANQIGEAETFSVTLKDGAEVHLYKCKTKDVGPVLELVAYALEQMDITSLSSTANLNLDNPALFLQLIANSSDKLFSLAARLCSLQREEFLELELDDSLAIVTELFRINKDFFLKSILPIVRSALQANQAASQ